MKNLNAPSLKWVSRPKTPRRIPSLPLYRRLRRSLSQGRSLLLRRKKKRKRPKSRKKRKRKRRLLLSSLRSRGKLPLRRLLRSVKLRLLVARDLVLMCLLLSLRLPRAKIRRRRELR